MPSAGRGAMFARPGGRKVARMKGLLKLAAAGLLVVVVARIARQWQLMQSRTVPTLHPFEDAEPYAKEPLEPEDLRVAQNSPL